MAYRNIEVDGKKYKYVIGKVAVKVRGIDAPMFHDGSIEIGPKIVAEFIRNATSGKS